MRAIGRRGPDPSARDPVRPSAGAIGGICLTTPGNPQPALEVHLDTDLLGGMLALEAFWSVLRDDWRALALAPAAFAGRPGTAAALLAGERGPDVDRLPYDPDTLEALRAARKAGRPTVLVDLDDSGLAAPVAAHLGLFDTVVSGPAEGRHAPPPRPARTGPGAGMARAALVLKQMRLHQWTKNVLVFLPMLVGHAVTPANLGWSLLAFLAFGLVASAVYVLNDLIDLPADRRHPTKCDRPFAAGALPLSAGSWMLPGLLAAGLGLAALGGLGLLGVMGLYALTTTAYSLKLKGTLGADIVVLAMLYTIRIIAGAVVTGISPSIWLLSFSVFLFLSLAAVKRLSELVYIENEGGRGRASGRAYTVEDRPVVAMMATSAGFLSVLVLALYIDSPEVSGLYAAPQVLWALGLGLLYWISRTVLLAHRGQVNQDPVVFALTDPVSRITALVLALIFIVASLG